jgi:hypothetical protein
MPLCDGSHKAAGWRCGDVSGDVAPLAFLASANLRNLADRLAHRFEAVSLNAVTGPLRCERLVILADGHNLEWLRQVSQRTEASNISLITIGMDSALAQWAFPEASCQALDDIPTQALWVAVESAVLLAPKVTTPRPRPTVFISHSSQDEAAIFPVLRVVREQLGVTVFLCADSIPAGAPWREEIRRNLTQCDLYLYIASESANNSVYCGFETGVASALDKTIRIVSVDGSPPPTHLSDVQATLVPRLMALKPWLNRSDAILEACLEALSS